MNFIQSFSLLEMLLRAALFPRISLKPVTRAQEQNQRHFPVLELPVLITLSAPFSLANIDFPVQDMFAQGGHAFQDTPRVLHRERRTISQTLLLKRGEKLHFHHKSYFIFFFPQFYLAWLSMSGTCLV